VFVNNYSNSLLIPNFSRIRNNFGPTDRIKEINISAAELIFEKDYIIIVLNPVLHLISYPIARRSIMFVVRVKDFNTIDFHKITKDFDTII
jgi:hypothetical protein